MLHRPDAKTVPGEVTIYPLQEIRAANNQLVDLFKKGEQLGISSHHEQHRYRTKRGGSHLSHDNCFITKKRMISIV